MAPPRPSTIFVSYTEADGVAARRIAEELERRGYRTWYYQRDVPSGQDYLDRVSAALDECGVVMPIISRRSLESHQVYKELAFAHDLDRPFVPVLIDVDYRELQREHRRWALMLGPPVAFRMNAPDQPLDVKPLVAGLGELGVMPVRAEGEGDGADRPAPKAMWASDANQLDVKALPEVVFTNTTIRRFLEGGNLHFLSATKGLGKTLLLTYKRMLLRDQYESEDSGRAAVHFVPEGRPYLDLMSDVSTLSAKHKNFLSDLANTKRLWSFALRLSAVSHQRDALGEEDEEDLAALPRHLRAWMKGGHVAPTMVVAEMLTLSVKELNRLLTTASSFIEYKFRGLHSGVFIFVDKVDQALRLLPRAAWVNVQAGLIEAAWDLMNANAHVKVYATIREEAFAGYESDIKANLFGATAALRYSTAELAALVDKLSRYYEGGSFREFTGFARIDDGRIGDPETAFEHVCRHTLGRPRDFVLIASRLSHDRGQSDEAHFQRLVDEVSSEMVVSNVFDEMRVFLDGLATPEGRRKLFSLVPSNVLTERELIEANCRFNGIEVEHFESWQDSSDIHHPFRELFDCGLLGVVDEARAVQRFKRPHDVSIDSAHRLPPAPYYLVHPSLDALIRKRRGLDGYAPVHRVRVGHDVPWRRLDAAMVDVDRCLRQLQDPDLRARVHALFDGVTPDAVPGELRRTPEADAVLQRLSAAEHEELYVLLDDLLAS